MSDGSRALINEAAKGGARRPATGPDRPIGALYPHSGQKAPIVSGFTSLAAPSEEDT
jgi:hypothetical protein